MTGRDGPPAKRQCTLNYFWGSSSTNTAQGTPQVDVATAHADKQVPARSAGEALTQEKSETNVKGVGASAARDLERIPPGAYSQREDVLVKREKEGDISFKYVLNNGEPQNFMYLIGLKNIFSKQLPNMPKEYIVRLVMDRRHRSVALLKRNGTVIGGITYRAFHAQGFGEIAFCAVTSHEQVKGYGTRLMNHTKEAARTHDRLTHFLTYADNNAVGYFEKQGFTREITLEKERWQGYIKDYDGGTLMECVIHPAICFTALPDMLYTQRLALDERIRQLSNAHVVRPGLRNWQQAAAAAGRGAAGGGGSGGDGNPTYLVVPIGDIPGVREAGWTPELAPQSSRYRLLVEGRGGGEPLEPTPDNLNAFLAALLEHIEQLEDSWPFRERVAVQEAPDYYDVIKDPIALDMMQQRLASHAFYVTLDIFTADLRRIFDNCRTYNAPDTVYYKLANKLEAQVNQYLAAHLVTEDDDDRGPKPPGLQ